MKQSCKIFLFVMFLMTSFLSFGARYPDGASTTIKTVPNPGYGGGGSINVRHFYLDGTSEMYSYAVDTSTTTRQLPRNDLWKIMVESVSFGSNGAGYKIYVNGRDMGALPMYVGGIIYLSPDTGRVYDFSKICVLDMTKPITVNIICLEANKGSGALGIKYYYADGTTETIYHNMYSVTGNVITLKRQDLYKAEVIACNYGGNPCIPHYMIFNNSLKLLIRDESKTIIPGTTLTFTSNIQSTLPAVNYYPGGSQVKVAITTDSPTEKGSLTLRYYYYSKAGETVTHIMNGTTSPVLTLSGLDLYRIEVAGSTLAQGTYIFISINDRIILGGYAKAFPVSSGFAVTTENNAYINTTPITAKVVSDSNNGGGSIGIKYYYTNGTTETILHPIYVTAANEIKLSGSGLYKAEIVSRNFGGIGENHRLIINNNVNAKFRDFIKIGETIALSAQSPILYPVKDQIRVKMAASNTNGGGNITVRYYYGDGTTQDVVHNMYVVSPAEVILSGKRLCGAEVINNNYGGSSSVDFSLIINDKVISQLGYVGFRYGKYILLAPSFPSDAENNTSLNFRTTKFAKVAANGKVQITFEWNPVYSAIFTVSQYKNGVLVNPTYTTTDNKIVIETDNQEYSYVLTYK